VVAAVWPRVLLPAGQLAHKADPPATRYVLMAHAMSAQSRRESLASGTPNTSSSSVHGPVQTRPAPLPLDAYPALHVQVAAPPSLLLKDGHAAQEVALPRLYEPAAQARVDPRHHGQPQAPTRAEKSTCRPRTRTGFARDAECARRTRWPRRACRPFVRCAPVPVGGGGGGTSTYQYTAGLWYHCRPGPSRGSRCRWLTRPGWNSATDTPCMRTHPRG
jgi:hypothetical protein